MSGIIPTILASNPVRARASMRLPGLFTLSLALLLSGCLGNEGIDDGAMTSTKATYESTDGRTEVIHLAPSDEILSADGQRRVAQPLLWHVETGRDGSIEWLDGSSRLVRFDLRCTQDENGHCVQHSVSYSSLGKVSLFGVQSNPVPRGGSVHSVDGANLRGGHSIELAEFRYDGSPLPVEVEWIHEDGRVTRWNRVALEGNSVHYERPSYGIEPRGGATEPEARFFPGDDVDIVGRGMTFVQAFETISAEHPEAEQDLSTGCVSLASVYISPHTPEPPVADIFWSALVDRFEFRLGLPDGAAKTWFLDRRVDWQGEMYHDIYARSGELATCPDRGNASYFSTNSLEAWDLFQSLEWSSEPFLSFKIRYLSTGDLFIYEFSAVPAHMEGEAMAGSTVYVADYVQVDARTGLLWGMNLDPLDYAKYRGPG